MQLTPEEEARIKELYSDWKIKEAAGHFGRSVGPSFAEGITRSASLVAMAVEMSNQLDRRAHPRAYRGIKQYKRARLV